MRQLSGSMTAASPAPIRARAVTGRGSFPCLTACRIRGRSGTTSSPTRWSRPRGTLIVIYVVLLWLGTAYWAFRDMQARTENPILPYFAVGADHLLHPAPLPLRGGAVPHRPPARVAGRGLRALPRRGVACSPRSRRTSSAPSAAIASTPTGWSARTAAPGCTASARRAAGWPIRVAAVRLLRARASSGPARAARVERVAASAPTPDATGRARPRPTADRAAAAPRLQPLTSTARRWSRPGPSRGTRSPRPAPIATR